MTGLLDDCLISKPDRRTVSQNPVYFRHRSSESTDPQNPGTIPSFFFSAPPCAEFSFWKPCRLTIRNLSHFGTGLYTRARRGIKEPNSYPTNSADLNQNGSRLFVLSAYFEYRLGTYLLRLPSPAVSASQSPPYNDSGRTYCASRRLHLPTLQS